MANSDSPRGWWSEHGIDVITALLTIVGLWIAYKTPLSLNDQDSAERLKGERSGAQIPLIARR
jgi:hypothetical protein